MSNLSFIHGQGFKDAPNLIEHKQQAMNVVSEALTSPTWSREGFSSVANRKRTPRRSPFTHFYKIVR